MLEHRRRRMTPYEPSRPTHPKGYGGVEALASLSLLPDALLHLVVASPCTHPRGTRNETRWGSSAAY